MRNKFKNGYLIEFMRRKNLAEKQIQVNLIGKKDSKKESMKGRKKGEREEQGRVDNLKSKKYFFKVFKSEST